MASESDSDSTFNPRRKLCPDGSCVGILGEDGKCTVCGTRDERATESPSPVPHTSDVLNASDDASDIEHDDLHIEHDEPDADNLPSDFDPHRRLCSDDDCIGVIGEDNRCRLCGKPA
jgi:hypothetical protein